jgi:hypothetical protein
LDAGARRRQILTPAKKLLDWRRVSEFGRRPGLFLGSGPIHFLAQIARMPAVAGQDADDWLPSVLCVMSGRGDDLEPASAMQTAETIVSSSLQMMVHPEGPHLSSPKAMTRRNGVPGGP